MSRPFEDFKLAWPLVDEAHCRRKWETLTDQEQDDAILFIPYAKSFCDSTASNRGMFRPSEYLLGWWHGIPAKIARKARQRWHGASPPTVPATDVDAVLRGSLKTMAEG